LFGPREGKDLLKQDLLIRAGALGVGL
jgi:hypothetical protein